ncbi:hypothetical protein BDC45DRAFT_257451 [Circinella umbellata]|nr:hypothetical protein BDC45DRAFT_257451 [Circinella umbellata]
MTIKTHVGHFLYKVSFIIVYRPTKKNSLYNFPIISSLFNHKSFSFKIMGFNGTQLCLLLCNPSFYNNIIIIIKTSLTLNALYTIRNLQSLCFFFFPPFLPPFLIIVLVTFSKSWPTDVPFCNVYKKIVLLIKLFMHSMIEFLLLLLYYTTVFVYRSSLRFIIIINIIMTCLL